MESVSYKEFVIQVNPFSRDGVYWNDEVAIFKTSRDGRGALLEHRIPLHDSPRCSSQKEAVQVGFSIGMTIIDQENR
jgi:hypothetical protein